MHHRIIFLCIVLLLSVSFNHAIRTEPVDPKQIPLKGAEKELSDQNMEGCEGVGKEEEECLLRRTLVAHTDYIYTQEHHH